MKLYGEVVSFRTVEGDKGAVNFFTIKSLDAKVKGEFNCYLGQDVNVGDRVAANVEENNGSWFVDGKSQVKVYPKKQPNKAGGYSKDTSGISCGHAINGAMLILLEEELNSDDVVEKAKMVHTVTERLKDEYRTLNPQMSDYDLGASVGNAVLNGCKACSKLGNYSEKSLEKCSKLFLDKIAVEVLAFIKG